MSEEKTIKEWLETLPEPYRTQALANASPHLLDYIGVDTVSTAVEASFHWLYSPEGHEYWHEFVTKLKSNE